MSIHVILIALCGGLLAFLSGVSFAHHDALEAALLGSGAIVLIVLNTRLR